MAERRGWRDFELSHTSWDHLWAVWSWTWTRVWS